MMREWCLLAVVAVLLAGCATGGPIPEESAQREPLPAELARGGTVPDGLEVLWGGQVVAINNEPGRTRLEVLAYPLASDQRPAVRDTSAQGRFIAEVGRFLDPVDYEPGRLVTVQGTITGLVQGKVGDAEYTWPEVAVGELHRWTREPETGWSPPRFNVGVGILFSN